MPSSMQFTLFCPLMNWSERIPIKTYKYVHNKKWYLMAIKYMDIKICLIMADCLTFFVALIAKFLRANQVSVFCSILARLVECKQKVKVDNKGC